MSLKHYPVQSDKARISRYVHFESWSKVAVLMGGRASKHLCGYLEPQDTKMAPALVVKRNLALPAARDI
jgi:hypothetical protein